MTNFVVAVDGPAGSGKSSVCKEAARRLGFCYLDTGAGYRAMAIQFERSGNLESAIADFDYEISLDPNRELVSLAGSDVTAEIRSPKVAELVRSVARDSRVRELQRSDARQRIEKCGLSGIIVEGRDITTVVAPSAQLRILLTASEEVRLRRRSKDQTEAIDNLLARDSSDSAVAEFMKPAEGVTLLDTSELDFEQSVGALLSAIEVVRNV
jgi:cytidylate kinase